MNSKDISRELYRIRNEIVFTNDTVKLRILNEINDELVKLYKHYSYLEKNELLNEEKNDIKKGRNK